MTATSSRSTPDAGSGVQRHSPKHKRTSSQSGPVAHDGTLARLADGMMSSGDPVRMRSAWLEKLGLAFTVVHGESKASPGVVFERMVLDNIVEQDEVSRTLPPLPPWPAGAPLERTFNRSTELATSAWSRPRTVRVFALSAGADMLNERAYVTRYVAPLWKLRASRLRVAVEYLDLKPITAPAGSDQLRTRGLERSIRRLEYSSRRHATVAVCLLGHSLGGTATAAPEDGWKLQLGREFDWLRASPYNSMHAPALLMHVAMWLEQRRPLRIVAHASARGTQQPANTMVGGDRDGLAAAASASPIPPQCNVSTADGAVWHRGLICLHYRRKPSFALSEHYKMDVPAVQHRALFSDDPSEIAQLSVLHGAVAEHCRRQSAFA